MSLCSLVEKLEFDAPVEGVFRFFTDTDQISSILTPAIPLKIMRRSTRHMRQGGFFELQTQLLGLPFLFRSHVHSMNRNRHIAHRWRGDWRTAWEQDDYFETIPGKRTRVTTCVLYSFPLGFIGSASEFILLRPWLKWFLHRRRTALASAFRKTTWPTTPETHKGKPTPSPLYLTRSTPIEPRHRQNRNSRTPLTQHT